MKRLIAVVLLTSLVAGSCGDDSDPSGGEAPRHDLNVFAAASLTDAFGEIVADFEATHAGVTVNLNFGPSDGLATQIREGAAADVFASASPRWMDDVADNGPGVSGRTDFARNRLTILVPAENPAGVHGIEDLTAEHVRLVLAAEGVPAGDYAREVLANAGILDAALGNLVSNEEDVKGVVQKVLLGEADAGIVYVTDVTEGVREQTQVIEIPDDINVIATYPIAVVNGVATEGLAQEFIDLVLADGQAVLARFGFLPAG
jgi:molybdate transport system substrate-binding protein